MHGHVRLSSQLRSASASSAASPRRGTRSSGACSRTPPARRAGCFTTKTCATDSHHDNVCQGTFSRCHTHPCPASKGQAELVVDAHGSVFLVLVSGGQRLACTLVTQPGPDRGTYACM